MAVQECVGIAANARRYCIRSKYVPTGAAPPRSGRTGTRIRCGLDLKNGLDIKSKPYVMSLQKEIGMRIVCLGGGPPDCILDPDEAGQSCQRHYRYRTQSSGWGIVFSDKTMDGFRRDDPQVVAEIERSFHHWDDVDVFFRAGAWCPAAMASAASGASSTADLPGPRANSASSSVRDRVQGRTTTRGNTTW